MLLSLEYSSEQYWRLIEISLESPFLVKQKVALMLLSKFPEYSYETQSFLEEARSLGGNWYHQNARTIDGVVDRIKRT
jgi:hypothetical protein